MARCSPISRLNSVDFPAFGRPIIATIGFTAVSFEEYGKANKDQLRVYQAGRGNVDWYSGICRLRSATDRFRFTGLARRGNLNERVDRILASQFSCCQKQSALHSAVEPAEVETANDAGLFQPGIQRRRIFV